MVMRAEHVGINVSDMDKSLHFYSEVLGFQLRRRAHVAPEVELAFLFHPDQPDFEIELVGRPIDTDLGKVNHLAFRVENIEAEVQRLTALGVEFTTEEPSLILGDTKVIFFKGPDGEKLELVER